MRRPREIEPAELLPVSGSRPTLSAVFRQYLPDVLSSIRRLRVPERHHEDVAQEVFVAVAKSLPSYDPARPFKPWLKTITYRVALRFMKTKWNCVEKLCEDEDLDTMDPTTIDNERRTATSREEALLDEILQTLDDDCREAYLMHELDDISYADIASALEVPKTTIISRMRRAREHVDAAVKRYNAAAEHRSRGGFLLPLVSTKALVDAARVLPHVSADVRDRIWRGVQGQLAAPSVQDGPEASDAPSSLPEQPRPPALRPHAPQPAAHLVQITRAQLAGGIISAVLTGAIGGGVAGRALAPPFVAPPPDASARPLLIDDTGAASLPTVALPPSAPLGASALTADGGADGAAPAPAPSASASVPQMTDKERVRMLLVHAHRELAIDHPDGALRDLKQCAQFIQCNDFAEERADIERRAQEQLKARAPQP